MGQSATLSVTNQTDAPVTITLGAMNCMYDDGEEGSNLQVFNNVVLQPQKMVPAEGAQYIVANADGSCAFEPSHFEMDFSPGGSVVITESHSSWSWECNPPQNFQVGGGADAEIEIMVVGSGAS